MSRLWRGRNLFISKTHSGLIRTVNEDSLFIKEPLFYAIADGMGGYAGGEIASKEVLEIFKAEIDSLQGLQEQELFFMLEKIVEKANSHIRNLGELNSKYENMGTTLVAIYFISQTKAAVINIGDSRLYLLRNKKLKQITQDHSWVAELMQKGEITEDDLFVHPQKNIILRAIGAEDNVKADII